MMQNTPKMYSRYVPNKLLIAHKSRLLQIRWCGVAHCPMFSDWSRKFTDFFDECRFPNHRHCTEGQNADLNIVIKNAAIKKQTVRQ